MNPFDFRTVPCLRIEAGLARHLGEQLRSYFPDQRRLCLVTDAFLHSSGLLDAALANLQAHHWTVHLITDVVADPPEHVVFTAADKARHFGPDVVLGLGGGSSMDVAKLLAVLLGSDQPLAEMYGIGQVKGPRLPLVQMPTTAGTGSEVTPISIVTTGQTTKSGVVSPVLYADIALLDAELTLGLPTQATAATGIDAMVHALEAYTTRHLKNPVSDVLALKALSLLSSNILLACRDGRNLAAREAMLLGSMLAGQAFANAPVGAVHALAYPIGGIFHVAHGLSNSLVLPHVMRFNMPQAYPLYAEIAGVVLPGCTGNAQDKATALIEFFESVAHETGIPIQLRQVGVQEKDLPVMAREAMQQTRLLGNNPREVTEENTLDIYTAAY